MDSRRVSDRAPAGTGRRAATIARPTAVVAALVSLLLALTASPGLLGAPTSGDHDGGRTWIVDAGAVLPAAAQVIGSLPLADAVIVTSPVTPAGAAALDAPVHPQSLTVTDEVGSIDSGVATTQAPAVWARGERGRQAVVALIDTGVADVAALEGAVAGEIDFSGTGGGDGYGHGTFLASLIAGRHGQAPGVAPEAGILSLKVADDDGSATLGAVLSALQWLHGPGRSAGIRIAAMAMAVEPGSEGADLLDRAVSRLAQAGVLVVTAAGNDGENGDGVTSPATAPGSFSVGAVDDRGTADPGDDQLAAFSSSGPDTAGTPQPDAVAAGVRVAGALPEGSVIADGIDGIGDGLYLGSGTSMSTAIAAGVAALASSARPDLDGHALDVALRASGGAVDAVAAHDHVLAQPDTPGRSGTAGPGNAAHGNPDNAGNGNGQGPPGDGEADPQSIRWTSIRWTSIRWTGSAWGDASWSMGAWGSIRWTGSRWAYDGPTPQSIRWTSIRWTWLS